MEDTKQVEKEEDIPDEDIKNWAEDQKDWAEMQAILEGQKPDVLDPDREVPAEGQHKPMIVKADEVDETGADITISQSTEDGNSTSFAENHSIDVPVTLSKPKHEIERPTPMTRIVVPARPQLRRETSAPAPPQQTPPPPAQPEREPNNATDSLSLMQLKKIVTEMPKGEATAYAFTYQDTAPLEEELEEWFTYSDEEREGLLHSRETFEKAWEKYIMRHMPTETHERSWIEVDTATRRKFVVQEVAGLEHPDVKRRGASLEVLLYVALGLWYDTGNTDDTKNEDGKESDKEAGARRPNPEHSRSTLQLKWMRIGAEAIYDGMGVQAIFDVFRGACLRALSVHIGTKKIMSGLY